MLTPAEKTVVDALDAKQGNVKAVSSILGLSISWVNRVKNQHWKPKDNIIHLPKDEKPPDLIPPNYYKLIELRDMTFDELAKLIREERIEARDLIQILRITLDYEKTTNSVIAPAMNIFNDNRSVNFNTLVQELSNLPDEKLKVIMGD